MKFFKIILIILTLAITGYSASVNKAGPVKKIGPVRTRALQDTLVCSGIKQCLGYMAPGCKENISKPMKDVKYTESFCADYKHLDSLGIKPRGKNKPIYKSLGKRYRVNYVLDGTLPVSKEMMDYLMNHMPFTTKLINAYQGTKYHVAYKSSDHTIFEATDGSDLAGKFRFVYRDDSYEKNIIWGYGGTKILMWKLVGLALAYLDYEAISKNEIKFEFRAVVFAGNGMIDRILNSGLFRKVVESIMGDIINNIQDSANEFARGNLKPTKKYIPLTGGLYYKQLQEFNKVIKDSGYNPPKKE